MTGVAEIIFFWEAIRILFQQEVIEGGVLKKAVARDFRSRLESRFILDFKHNLAYLPGILRGEKYNPDGLFSVIMRNSGKFFHGFMPWRPKMAAAPCSLDGPRHHIL